MVVVIGHRPTSSQCGVPKYGAERTTDLGRARQSRDEPPQTFGQRNSPVQGIAGPPARQRQQ
jgi:hypothetical protein